MTLAEFHNGLRILSSIDFHELAAAGAITDDAHGEVEWEHFRANPWRYFIAAEDDCAAKIWTIVSRRAAYSPPDGQG
jgi:hypothetical protein